MQTLLPWLLGLFFFLLCLALVTSTVIIILKSMSGVKAASNTTSSSVLRHDQIMHTITINNKLKIPSLFFSFFGGFFRFFVFVFWLQPWAKDIVIMISQQL